MTKTILEVSKSECLSPSPPSTDDLCTWYGHGCGRAKHLELYSHRLYGEKTRSLESSRARKCKKNQRQRERRSADIWLIAVILDIMYNARSKKRIYHPLQMHHSWFIKKKPILQQRQTSQAKIARKNVRFSGDFWWLCVFESWTRG